MGSERVGAPAGRLVSHGCIELTQIPVPAVTGGIKDEIDMTAGFMVAFARRRIKSSPGGPAETNPSSDVGLSCLTRI